jgi:photosystem II stability/assembly factor-like uncharacterized protein
MATISHDLALAPSKVSARQVGFFLAILVFTIAAITGSFGLVGGSGLDEGSAPVRDVGLVAPGTGWLLQGQRLLWTTDNGANWSNIAPTNAPVQPIDGVFFLNSLYGWTILSRKGPGDKSPLVFIASTTNGGQSWETHQFAHSEESGFDLYVRSASIFFVDKHHGWVTMRLASSSNFSMGLLFTTTDGGATWDRLPDPPSADPIYFRNSSQGWLAGGPVGDKLWSTQDGGASWREEALSLPLECLNCKILYSNPNFSSIIDGVLPVSMESEDRSLTALYVTHDGGQGLGRDRGTRARAG